MITQWLRLAPYLLGALIVLGAQPHKASHESGLGIDINEYVGTFKDRQSIGTALGSLGGNVSYLSGPLHLSMLTLADLTQANGGPPENDRIGSNNDSRDRGNVIVEPVNKMAQSPEEEREGGAVFFFGLLISLGIAWLYTTWPR